MAATGMVVAQKAAELQLTDLPDTVPVLPPLGFCMILLSTWSPQGDQWNHGLEVHMLSQESRCCPWVKLEESNVWLLKSGGSLELGACVLCRKARGFIVQDSWTWAMTMGVLDLIVSNSFDAPSSLGSTKVGVLDPAPVYSPVSQSLIFCPLDAIHAWSPPSWTPQKLIFKDQYIILLESLTKREKI